MIIVDRALKARAEQGKPIRVGMMTAQHPQRGAPFPRCFACLESEMENRDVYC